MALRTVSGLHRIASRLARAEGRAGMSDELGGRDPAPRYGVAYSASLCRDRLGQVLEGMRP
jgi:hypothetical protein